MRTWSDDPRVVSTSMWALAHTHNDNHQSPHNAVQRPRHCLSWRDVDCLQSDQLVLATSVVALTPAVARSRHQRHPAYLHSTPWRQLVSWSLTSLFSTNTATSETKPCPEKMPLYFANNFAKWWSISSILLRQTWSQFPEHLERVATLPCEILITENQRHTETQYKDYD